MDRHSLLRLTDEHCCRERMLEAQVDDAAAQNQIALSDGQTNAAIATLESIQSGDNLMSCIDTIEQELPGVFTELLSLTRDHYADATASLHKNSKSAIMLSLSPLRYFLRSLRLIKAPDLEPTLLALPFHYVQRILVLLVQLAQIGLEVELSCRCAIFLLVCHQNQVAASSSLAPFVVNLRDAIANSLASYRFMVGTNMAGLGFLNNQLSASSQDIEAHKTLKQSDSSSSSTQLRKRKATSS